MNEESLIDREIDINRDFDSLIQKVADAKGNKEMIEFLLKPIVKLAWNKQAELLTLIHDIKQCDIENNTLDLPQSIRVRMQDALNV